MIKLSYDDIFDLAESYSNEDKDVTFYLNGVDAMKLAYFLETELDIIESEELYYDGEFNEYKIYAISISNFNGETEYVLEEAYLNGTFLYNECEDVYIDERLNFRDNDIDTRLDGNKIMFEMINGSGKYQKR